jgi:adenine deaminase
MVKVKAIDQVTKILTRELTAEMPVKDGKIEMDLAHDIIKVAAIEYKYTGGKIFTGFIRGLGLHQGAVATSTAWDCSDIMVAGADETDMAKAVNRIKELKGGTVVCRNGEILAEIAFPVFSVISEEPMETLSDKLTLIQTAATAMGSRSDDIRTTLSVLATPAIPYVRMCESGLFNVRLNAKMDLVIAGE